MPRCGLDGPGDCGDGERGENKGKERYVWSTAYIFPDMFSIDLLQTARNGIVLYKGIYRVTSLSTEHRSYVVPPFMGSPHLP